MQILDTLSRHHDARARALRLATENDTAPTPVLGFCDGWRSTSGRVLAVRLGAIDWEVVELSPLDVATWRIAAMRAEATRLEDAAHVAEERMRHWRPATRAQVTPPAERRKQAALIRTLADLAEALVRSGLREGLTGDVLARTVPGVEATEEVA
jgi:hypothetical protein